MNHVKTFIYQIILSMWLTRNRNIYSTCSVSPDDLSLRMGEYELNGTNEPHGHIDRKVQIVASHPKFDPKT